MGYLHFKESVLSIKEVSGRVSESETMKWMENLYGKKFVRVTYQGLLRIVNSSSENHNIHLLIATFEAFVFMGLMVGCDTFSLK